MAKTIERKFLTALFHVSPVDFTLGISPAQRLLPFLQLRIRLAIAKLRFRRVERIVFPPTASSPFGYKFVINESTEC